MIYHLTRQAVFTVIVVVIQTSRTFHSIRGILMLNEAGVWDKNGADDFTGASGGDKEISVALNTDSSTGTRKTIRTAFWK